MAPRAAQSQQAEEADPEVERGEALSGNVGGTPRPLRAGVVGAGLMGRWHAHAIRHIGGRVVALLDQDLGRAGTLAARLPDRPVVATDVASAVRDQRIQVIHVCTPVATHEPIVRSALEAGVPVMAEKPLAPDAEAVERLHRLADGRGLLLCPVYQYLCQSGVLAAMRTVPRLGSIRHLDLMTCSAGAEGGLDVDPEAVALDILPHGLALARRLLGASVAAADWRVGGGAPGEIRAFADVGGASIALAVSMHARPTENTLTVRCDGGTVRVNLFHGFATVERGKPSRLDKIGRPFVTSVQGFGAAVGNLTGRAVRGEVAYPGLRELVRRFHCACAGEGASPVSVEESIDVARARDRIESARNGVGR